MFVFSVYIPFHISRVRPVHSFFEKKSILENPSQIFTNLFFNAYLKCHKYTILFLKNVIHKSKKRNKLAGYDFGKSLNAMVLQKRAPAKSHEKTWELAGRFPGVEPYNWLIFNE